MAALGGDILAANGGSGGINGVASAGLAYFGGWLAGLGSGGS